MIMSPHNNSRNKSRQSEALLSPKESIDYSSQRMITESFQRYSRNNLPRVGSNCNTVRFPVLANSNTTDMHSRITSGKHKNDSNRDVLSFDSHTKTYSNNHLLKMIENKPQLKIRLSKDNKIKLVNHFNIQKRATHLKKYSAIPTEGCVPQKANSSLYQKLVAGKKKVVENYISRKRVDSKDDNVEFSTRESPYNVTSNAFKQGEGNNEIRTEPDTSNNNMTAMNNVNSICNGDLDKKNGKIKFQTPEQIHISLVKMIQLGKQAEELFDNGS